MYALCVGCLRIEDRFFFVKQKPAYEMRISGWSSDVCSSDLIDLDLETPGLGPAPLPSGLGFLDVVARHAIGLSGGESWAGSLGRSAGQPGRICLISRLPYFAAVCWMRICRAREIGRASCRERVCQYV